MGDVAGGIVKYGMNQVPGVKEGREAFGKLRGLLEKEVDPTKADGTPGGTLGDAASTRSPEATKALNDLLKKANDASDALDDILDGSENIQDGVDQKGMHGLAKIYDGAGDISEGAGKLLGPFGGPLAKQIGNLFHKMAEGLDWFASHVLDPLSDALTLPEGMPHLPTLRDPLILDLDGLGVSLTSLSGSTAHFDFTGSGFATQTGWMGAGDGMLVTAPADGSSTIRAGNVLGAQSGNAFADLAALDENGDGIIDASDSAFANLRVWVDNGDASSSGGELHTLTELGIVSISLAQTLVNKANNGNTVVASATFVRVVDGQTHTNTISEVNFATNTQVTKFILPEGFAYSEAAMKLPELIGYGHLPDLWAAMTLNQDLLDSVKALILNSATMSAGEFDQAFENIIFKWAGVENVDPSSRGPYVDARHLEVALAFYGVDETLNPEYALDPTNRTGPNTWEPLYRDIVKMFEVRFVTQINVAQFLNGVDLDDTMSNPFSIFGGTEYDRGTDRLVIDAEDLASSTLSFIQSHPADESAIWAKISPIFADLKVDWNYGSASADMVGTAGTPIQQKTIFKLGAGDDGVFADSDQGSVIVYSRGDGSDTLHLSGTDTTNTALLFTDVLSDNVAFHYSGLDLLITVLPDGNTITVANQFASISSGVDHVTFADGSTWSIDRILANLSISIPQADGQTVSGSSTADILLSGSGMDLLQGGAGNDIYLWGRGAGHDVIKEAPSEGSLDRLALIGVAANQVTLVRNGNDVTIVVAESTTGASDGGSVLLKDSLNEYYNRGVERVTFGDGTVWTRADIRRAVLDQAGTAGNDSITDFNTDDILRGRAGDDILLGASGNDTYIYARGDGNDTITDADDYSTDDRLVLTGINPADVTLQRNGNDVTLVIAESVVGAGDGGTILLKSNLDDYYQNGIEKVVFDNGTIWTRDTIRVALLAQASTSGNDVITGFNVADIINGGAGNDTITAADGNDLITGGTGNDTLNGGEHNDT
ncbi:MULTISPECIES: calcium-binding protein, partial [Rhizobium]